jgi:hypothetical protein
MAIGSGRPAALAGRGQLTSRDIARVYDVPPWLIDAEISEPRWPRLRWRAFAAGGRSEMPDVGAPKEDLFPGLDLARSHRALQDIAEAGPLALEAFEKEDYDWAGTELIRVERAIRAIQGIRREQRAKAKKEADHH